jgi:thiol-disulfide isomerase/thioredoxin
MKRNFIAAALTITATVAILATASCTRGDIVVESPEAMAFANFPSGSDFKATKVIMSDTATTVNFRLEYPIGGTFQFSSQSFLKDELGNRYPLRSAVGTPLDKFIPIPDSGFMEFTMNFEPMPRKVQMFDYIEFDGNRAFMLLGIHDKKIERNVPTFEQLSAKNRYKVPDDWFKTDTITIRGRFEGYDAEKFGFSSMEMYFNDVFSKKSTTIVLEIAADGTFERRFVASYPINNEFHTYESKIGLNELSFFARPGETIDITVRPGASGRYECFYNTGSSKEVERWLKASHIDYLLLRPLAGFGGNFDEAKIEAEKLWKNLLLYVNTIGQRNRFSPMEMQLALADMQIEFTYALLDYAMHREYALMRQEKVEIPGGYSYYTTVVTDSVEHKKLYEVDNYSQLHRIDFDNPLLVMSNNFSTVINRFQFSKPIKRGGFINEKNMETWIENNYVGLCGMTGCDHDNLVAQICGYKNLQNDVKTCQDQKNNIIPQILANKNIPDSIKQTLVAEAPVLDSLMPHHLAHFTKPYIRQKAEQYIAKEMAQTEPATPLPNNASADFIRSFNAKYPGRYLVFDFWGMGCGPCRRAIEDSKPIRVEIAKRTDVKLVFIAEEFSYEGSEPYKKYVSEWLADEETVCVPVSEFARLQELFEFNGIPHYETITPDGRRVREDLKFEGVGGINDFSINNLIEKLK